ncbi:unnamed protein product [Pocillopora meandrina]|uniref:Uncharacterized protein n=1 Tax=Pocillopora meandrina TaxID=46732 RepID=A0AAU9XI25_9CNID|nr:unnamed protein product [Pocillopora meandrina]
MTVTNKRRKQDALAVKTRKISQFRIFSVFLLRSWTKEQRPNCPCVAGGLGCTEVRRCFNCGNIVKARADPGKTLKRKKRSRATVSPYKRKRDHSS